MKPINGWTKQGIIDHILANYKGRSTNSNGTCLYRGDNGRRCAVGVFIPDDDYTLEMECKSAAEIWREFYPLRQILPFEASDLMILQQCHDEGSGERSDLIKFLEDNVE